MRDPGAASAVREGCGAGDMRSPLRARARAADLAVVVRIKIVAALAERAVRARVVVEAVARDVRAAPAGARKRAHPDVGRLNQHNAARIGGMRTAEGAREA